ncbi:MAG: histidine kinase [Acidimicrobiia bacterium]|nr:histidine kinase [Acidimicrobiia bacterium]
MRRRLLLACISVTALAVLLLAVPLAVIIQQRQADQDRRELTGMAAQAADRVPDDLRSPETALALTPSARHLHVAVYRPDHTRVAGNGPPVLEPAGQAVFSDVVAETTTRGQRVVVVPIIAAHQVTGAVRAAESLSIGRRRVRQAWAALAAGAIAVLLVASGVALWLARRLTRPLEQLRADALRIGDGDFTVTPLRTGVAEVDEVGEALATTAEHLGELLMREQAFSADASHQLRTPLTGLRLSLENELAHPRHDGQLALREALADVERLETTITGLLELARESSRATRQPFDINALLREVGRRWQGPLGADGRTLHVEAQAPVPPVAASRVAVEHVLDVLLDNARRHGAGEVNISTEAHRQIVLIRVTDEGVGVADPVAVFQRRHPDAKGTGIGLALARRLAEAEGGQLRLARAGPQPEFELSLPAALPPGSTTPSDT